MTALDDLRTMLDTYTQMYRDHPEVTEKDQGPVKVVTVNTYPDKSRAPAQDEVVDLLLTFVGPKPDTPPIGRQEFLDTLLAALTEGSGEFASMSPGDFAGGPSYITLGGWLGSQDLALGLIGLGKILGLWSVVSGLALGMNREQALSLAGDGFLMPIPTREISDLLRREPT